MQYRYERKYLLSSHTAAILRGRARAVMRPDAHAGSYEVCNLYLDDRYDSFYQAKYLGRSSRDKYRVRYYNGDLSFIRLERKHKDGDLIYKDTIEITQEQYQNLLSGDLGFILSEQDPAWRRLGVLHRLRTLRPAASFAYRREAYTYGPGDVRLTFDGHPYPLGAPRPVPTDQYGLLLELKFSRFLPDVIAQLLHGLPLARTDMSKYCIARERGMLRHERTQRFTAEHAAG